MFKAEGRPDSRPAEAGETPLGSRVRGVFQPQPKEEKSDKSDKTDKSGKDAKEAKEGKDTKDANASRDPKAAAAPAPALPLKSDNSLSAPPAR